MKWQDTLPRSFLRHKYANTNWDLGPTSDCSVFRDSRSDLAQFISSVLRNSLSEYFVVYSINSTPVECKCCYGIFLFLAILNSVEPGTRIAGRLKKCVWDYDLFQVLTLVLKQDFSSVTGSWETASKLAMLLRLVMPQHHCLALEACLNFDSFGPDMVI
jgi:hypothetical protein